MYEGSSCPHHTPRLKRFPCPMEMCSGEFSKQIFHFLVFIIGSMLLLCTLYLSNNSHQWSKDWLLAIKLHAASSYHLIVILPNSRLDLVMHFPLSLSGCSQHPTPNVSLMETIPRPLLMRSSQIQLQLCPSCSYDGSTYHQLSLPTKTPDLSLALIPI